MTGPTLSVTVAATFRDLVTLDALMDRLGLSTDTGNAELQRLITARSQAIYAFCGLAADQTGRRTFSRETMVATWYAGSRRTSQLILPWRIPVGTITSIVEDDVTLDTDQYVVNPMAALIQRIEDDSPCWWSCGKIVITYQAGWVAANDDATTMPADLQDACLQECVTRWRARGRDPSLRSETVPDVHQYTVGYGQDGERNGLLPETEAVLSAGGYQNVSVG